MIDQQRLKHYERLEMLLTKALARLRPHLSETACSDVSDFIDHGEYGLGWELLWYLAHDKNLTVPDELTASGELMGFDVTNTHAT